MFESENMKMRYRTLARIEFNSICVLKDQVEERGRLQQMTANWLANSEYRRVLTIMTEVRIKNVQHQPYSGMETESQSRINKPT